ncbi:MAG: histidine triad nucleotide-binding protein [Acidobacteriota bacterium]|nr:histidine triad nucleotide-binding protein [Acidobacteriota bacterium]
MSPPFADASCLFCRIGRREIPAKIVFENEHVLAFHDVAPKAPTHVLVIPKTHLARISETSEADTALLVDCLAALRGVARSLSLESYRVVANDGADAGQSVFHVHFHLLGGRAFAWPPG